MGIKIISISVPGFGLSEGPPVGQANNLTQFANDVAAVVNKEGVKHFHLIGYGAGGIHATAAAFGNMKRVQNFLLLAPLTPASIVGLGTDAHPETSMMKQIWTLPLIGKAAAWAVANFMSPETRLGFEQDFNRDLKRLQNDGRRVIIRGQQLDLGKFLYADQDYSLSHTWRAISPEQIIDTLPFELSDIRVRGSVGVAFTLDDSVHPPAMSRWYCTRIPKCTLTKYEIGYGHRFPLTMTNIDRAIRFIKYGQNIDV